MTIHNLYRETTSALLSNKSRSGLTVLGIVIGIASVIIMLAVGTGASNSITSSVSSLGSNILTVSSGASRGPGSQVSGAAGSSQSLTRDDATAIGALSGVKNVSPEVNSQKQVVAKNENANISVVGVVSEYPAVHNITMLEGSFISDKNISRLSRVIVIGPTVRDDLFGVGAEAIGQTVVISNQQFTVVGVTVAQGGSGFSNPDDTAYIPISVAQQMFTGNKYVSSISVEVESNDQLTSVTNSITTLLMKRHNITDSTKKDFNILNQASLSSSLSSITTILTYLLASIAAISLVVGGIGIMNMMLTTVTERTKEIGLRKAIGAKRKDISMQFLAESIALTFTGGIVGVTIGWGVAHIITLTGILTTSVTAYSVILSVGVSVLIGLIFGYFPARRAASLNPIEALRYE
jgi:putative ABC transport system permease protein